MLLEFVLFLVVLDVVVVRDVHLNSGPVRHPCTVCYKPVKLNERALSCDMCQHWTHCHFSGVSVVDYQRLQGLDQFTWMCPFCYASSLPFADCSVLSSVDTSSSDGLSVISDSSVASALFIPKDCDWCNLRMAHLNCRSLLAHLEDILTLASDGCIDVFALSETWLDETVSDAELCPWNCGFYIVRNDRNRQGGGVAFLLANHVRYVTRPDLCIGGIETLWLQLFPGSKRCWFGVPTGHYLVWPFMIIYRRNVSYHWQARCINFAFLVILILTFYSLPCLALNYLFS